MKSILWVEDEKDQYKIFSYKVLPEYKVETATDYERALALFNEKEYDLYVVDIILPSGRKMYSEKELMEIREKYFGLELIFHIRNVENLKPIIVLSVVNEKWLIDKIKSAGPNIEILWKYNVESKNVKELCDKLLLHK